MPIQTLASLSLIGASSLWGLYWVPLHFLETQGLSGIVAVAVLNVMPALALLAVAFRTKGHRPLLMRALFVGAIGGMGFGLYSAGIVYGSVVRATLLFYLTPIWSTLIGMIVLSEAVTWRRWLAIAFGLGGLMLLVGGADQPHLSLGDGFALLSGLAWAIAAVLIKRSPELPLAALTGSQFAVTAALALGLGAILGTNWPEMAVLAATLPIGSAIALVIFMPSVIAIFWAQKHIFPGRAGLLMMSEVVVAVVSAAIFLPEERLGTVQWVGASLIVATFLIETIRFPKTSSRRSNQAA